MIIEDHFYPKINESLNSSGVNNLEFKTKHSKETQFFLQ